MRILALSLIALMAAPAFAQTATPAATDDKAMVVEQLQKVLNKKNSPEKMGQAIALGSLLNCTQKTAGKDATNAFYQQVQTVSQTVREYCKQGNATEARALVLATVQQHKANPVVSSMLGCYDADTASLNTMAGPKAAADAAKYARWLRDPATAANEIKETDICRKKVNSNQ